MKNQASIQPQVPKPYNGEMKGFLQCMLDNQFTQRRYVCINHCETQQTKATPSISDKKLSFIIQPLYYLECILTSRSAATVEVYNVQCNS